MSPAPQPLPARTRLTLRRIYIIPTRHGLLFALLLLAMLLGSINYDNSLAYVLTFLLGSTLLVSILHTYRNVAALEVGPGHALAVFAGQRTRFEMRLGNDRGPARSAIALGWSESALQTTDVPQGGSAHLALPHVAARRGILRPGRLLLRSQHPLGLFRAWSWLSLDLSCIVYPAPAGDPAPLPSVADGRGDGAEGGEGSNDFSGLRRYHPGDSPRRVAWKAVAQGRGMLTKQFSGQTAASEWLEWDSLPQLGAEARLSQLCRWVLDAHRAGRSYGLRLPGHELGPAGGEAHLRRCLTTLALYGLGTEQ
jgi:uncharacterized protein (DUF58 family)